MSELQRALRNHLAAALRASESGMFCVYQWGYIAYASFVDDKTGYRLTCHQGDNPNAFAKQEFATAEECVTEMLLLGLDWQELEEPRE